MSSLTDIEKLHLEKLLGMSGGIGISATAGAISETTSTRTSK